MTCEEAVRAAANPQEAMLAIARTLDDLVADRTARSTQYPSVWGEWSSPNQHESSAPVDNSMQIIQNGDTAEVVLPRPSADRWHKRHEFAMTVLDLPTALGGDEEWCAHYAEGGPLWLYTGNRQLVVSYPAAVKQAMIEDVELDSPQDAADMGRDILKVPTDETPKVTLNDW